MGLYFYTPEEANEEKERQIEEIKIFAQECRDLTKDTPNNQFPDYLWTVAMNVFDSDNYMQMGLITDEAMQRIYRIGARQNSYPEYVRAMHEYHDYIQYVEENFGDWYSMVQASKMGMPIVVIPRKPRMAKKKRNKINAELGIIPSRHEPENVPSVDEVMAVIDSLEVYDFDPTIELPKRVERQREQASDHEVYRERINGISASKNSMLSESADAIINFLMNGEDPAKTAGSEEWSLYDAIIEETKWDYVDPEIVKIVTAVPSSYIINGSYIGHTTSNEEEIMSILRSNGYLSISDVRNSTLSNTAVRAFLKKYGEVDIDTEGLTNKQIKKKRKAAIKRRKAALETQVSDEKLQGILNFDKLSLDVDSNEFRLANVIKRIEEDDE